jgi:hypothetical protein
MNLDIKLYPITCAYATVSMVEHKSIKETLLNIIDAEPFDGTNPTIKKVDWHSSTEFDRPWINLIKPILENYMKIMGEALGYENPTITDLWFQQYHDKNHHPWHIHGQQMVGVYYLELPDDAPRTELVSPFLQKDRLFAEVKEGDVLVFPSEVVHRAPVVNNMRKTILSWNFHFEQPNRKTLEIINKL